MIPGEQPSSSTTKQSNKLKSEFRKRKKKRNKSINLEQIPHSEEPLPINFITNRGLTLVDEASALLSKSIDSERFNGSFNATFNSSFNASFKSRSYMREMTLETIDSEMEEPIPQSFDHANTVTFVDDTVDQVDIENGVRIKVGKQSPEKDDRRESEYSKHTFHSENTKADSGVRHTHGSNTVHNNGDYVSDSNANLAIATPVDESDEELTVWEAEKYAPQYTISKYKTWKYMGLTLTLLFIISTVVALSVHFGIKQIKKDTVQVVYVTPSPTHASTLPPTSARDAAITQTIESNALQRNAKFNTMSADDPRILALDWILHDDEMQLEANDPSLIQRYRLALLAFPIQTS
jgi:hypothetical protein